jgi:hypothetical protein
MGELINALEVYLKNKKVKFEFETSNHFSDLQKDVVVATNARDASHVLSLAVPETSAKLKQIEILPLNV